ncbi:cytochrome c3 family protein [Pseudoneobacillus sp. C159]
MGTSKKIIMLSLLIFILLSSKYSFDQNSSFAYNDLGLSGNNVYSDAQPVSENNFDEVNLEEQEPILICPEVTIDEPLNTNSCAQCHSTHKATQSKLLINTELMNP